MAYAYHEVDKSSLDKVLQEGLKRTSRGDKGSDKYIVRTDKLLDNNCPIELTEAGVSRDNNLYAYLEVDGKLCDIKNGQLVILSDFISSSKQAVLRLNVDPVKSFVSDLDAYDALKQAVVQNSNEDAVNKLTQEYWSKIVKLSDYTVDSVQRPELMITYDIEPKDLFLIN